jgi:hypothetical protein
MIPTSLRPARLDLDNTTIFGGLPALFGLLVTNAHSYLLVLRSSLEFGLMPLVASLLSTRPIELLHQI